MALALAVAAGVGAAGAGFVGDNDVDVAVEITPLPSATGFEVPDDVSPSATASAPPSASASGPTTTAGPSGARTSLGATPSGAGEDQIGYTGSDAGKLAALAVAAVALGALLFHWARRRLKDRWANGTPVG
jgi:hypothetical protein